VPEASSQARRFVRDSLIALGVESLIESAELGVSELVTNACLHARTPIVVALRMPDAGVVRIEVSDDSALQPHQRDYNELATTGRGLRLLSAYGVWGVDAGPGTTTGKTVWFQPSDQPPEPFESAFASLDDWPDL
jgi:anti-sigma regulatory factor (Ser/Thr protein kinase)